MYSLDVTANKGQKVNKEESVDACKLADVCGVSAWWVRGEWGEWGEWVGVLACLPMMSAVVSLRDAGDSVGFTVAFLCERSTWSLWAFSSEASLLHTCDNGSA